YAFPGEEVSEKTFKLSELRKAGLTLGFSGELTAENEHNTVTFASTDGIALDKVVLGGCADLTKKIRGRRRDVALLQSMLKRVMRETTSKKPCYRGAVTGFWKRKLKKALDAAIDRFDKTSKEPIEYVDAVRSVKAAAGGSG
ncbi:hypothetical protein JYT28_01815, partial [Desulfobulbus sp. AH-315-M07]|nr:hypothetical protein [Desulfobulbus sp. AH-315-M07]